MVFGNHITGREIIDHDGDDGVDVHSHVTHQNGSAL